MAMLGNIKKEQLKGLTKQTVAQWHAYYLAIIRLAPSVPEPSSARAALMLWIYENFDNLTK